MVVISIISLISSTITQSTRQARVKADDAKKQAQVHQVDIAVSQQRDATKKTPLNYNCGGAYCSSGTGDSVAVEGTPAFNASMQELVTNGYMSSIPDSTDDSYIYYANADADQAAFGVKLNSPKSPTNNNYCPSLPAPYSSCAWQNLNSYTPAGTDAVFPLLGGYAVSFCRIYGPATSANQCQVKGGNGLYSSACDGLYTGIPWPSLSSDQGAETNLASTYLALGSGGGGGTPVLVPACAMYYSGNPAIVCQPSANAVQTCSGGGTDSCACI